jgi:hypothetical protein
MRNTRARELRKRVLQYMKDRRIDMKLFKFNYRRVKKAYTRGEYAIT